MRFLITPGEAAHYDRRMVQGLASALKGEGHEADATASPLSEEETTAKCGDVGIDVLVQVNRSRPIALSPTVRHITWYQDIFPSTLETIAATVRTGDIVYVLGDPMALGLNIPLRCPVHSLFTGVDDVLLRDDSREQPQDVDFTLCGFIPPPWRGARWYTKPFINMANEVSDYFGISLPPLPLPTDVRAALVVTVEQTYRPLQGELDIHELSGALRAAAASFIANGVCRERKPSLRLSNELRRTVLVENFLDYLTREYPRYLDRASLVTEALHISSSLELYGQGWASHPQFRTYFRGVVHEQSELLGIYRRSRLNLANNTHGLGLHSRTLECMAVGGFIFMHASPRDAGPGGMHTSFEPDAHYGMYSPENLADEARRWLRDEAARRAAGRRARQIIMERHLWRHRAQQILKDLAA